MARQPVKRVSVRKEKLAVIHVCTEKEQINRLSQILVGNGNPEDGYVFKVISMAKEIQEINTRITGIYAVVNELHEASVGSKAVEKSLADKRKDFIKIASFIIGALSLVATAYLSFIGNKQTIANTQKIDNLGTPVIVNPRGVATPLPDGNELKFFPKDFIGEKDTINGN